MTAESEGETVRVLDEGDAVELLAYLVTAARTQVDEAAEYAPMREIRRGVSETTVQAGDPAGYADRLDALCQAVAEYLVRSLGLDTSP